MATKRSQIYLYKEIGGWGTPANQVIDEIQAAGKSPIDLHINSPGGDVFDGYAIYNALRRHSDAVDVYIDGLAASIASYIAMAGSTVRMAENAMLMIHMPYSGGGGTAEEMRKNADVLDMITNSLVDAYASRTGIPDEEIRKMLDEETWMDAQQALAFGFVDVITEPLEMAAKFDVKALSKFKNVPQKLMSQLQTAENHPQITQIDADSQNESTPEICENRDQRESADNKPSIFSRVKSMLADKADILAQLDAYKAEIADQAKEIEKLSNLVTVSSSAADAAQTELAEYKAAAADLEARITELENEAKTASERAIDIVAAAGFEETKLPAVEPADAGTSAQSLLEQYESIKDAAERTKFFRANKDAINKANAELKAKKKQ